MEMRYFKWYSERMGREMGCKQYGHAGRPVLFVPCQDGRFFDFENFKMIDTWAPWIESGKVMVFSIDTVDQETWSNLNGDPYWRIRRYIFVHSKLQQEQLRMYQSHPYQE